MQIKEVRKVKDMDRVEHAHSEFHNLLRVHV